MYCLITTVHTLRFLITFRLVLPSLATLATHLNKKADVHTSAFLILKPSTVQILFPTVYDSLQYRYLL